MIKKYKAKEYKFSTNYYLKMNFYYKQYLTISFIRSIEVSKKTLKRSPKISENIGNVAPEANATL